MLKTSYKKYEKFYKRFQNDQQKRNNRMIMNYFLKITLRGLISVTYENWQLKFS